jgi:hypothetical protein
MSFLSAAKTIRYGALIDIGSGSVLVAIIRSDATKRYPEVIWAKREYAPLRKSASLTDSAKHVMTSLVNALMLLDSEGRKAFLEKTGQTKLPETQVTIAAPWSYTISKNITYSHAEPFTVSRELIDELLRTAHQKVEEEIVQNEKVDQLGLSVITRSVIGLSANGYTQSTANNQRAKTLRVVEASAIAQDYLIHALEEAREKVLPETKLSLYSFILVYFDSIRQLFPETSEYCIVDITFEATELGVVRDGLLSYTTHTPFGSFSLARELSEILGVPLEEAFGYLHTDDPLALITLHSKEAQADAVTVFEKYQEKLVDLFHETGDSLAIPKKIFLHGNLRTENFFAKQISDAARKATNTSHAMYPVSKELVQRNYPAEIAEALTDSDLDTALLISAQFFHTEEQHRKFEQL